MRHILVTLAAIPLSLVMAVTFIPATIFALCHVAFTHLVAWRDA